MICFTIDLDFTKTNSLLFGFIMFHLGKPSNSGMDIDEEYLRKTREQEAEEEHARNEMWIRMKRAKKWKNTGKQSLPIS